MKTKTDSGIKEAAAEAMPKEQKNLPLRSLNEVLAEIREYYDREGWIGVQGFSVTVRSRISSSNLKWGDLKLYRNRIVRKESI